MKPKLGDDLESGRLKLGDHVIEDEGSASTSGGYSRGLKMSRRGGFRGLSNPGGPPGGGGRGGGGGGSGGKKPPVRPV